MKSEKVKEIKELIEEEILIATSFDDKLRRVPTKFLQEILTLINELESENERLQNKNYQLAQDLGQCENGYKLELHTARYQMQSVNEDLKKAKNRISELESENAELKKYKLDWLNSEKMHLQADMEDTEFELYCTNKAFKKVGEENQQLKDRIVGLEKENARLNKLFTYDKSVRDRCFEFIKDIKEEALKQFAERLKEKKMDIVSNNGSFNIFGYGVFVESIDETLKEFVE